MVENISNKELLHLLNQRTRLFSKEINHILKDYGLYNSQWSVLFCINRFGPMSQTDIWKYLNVEAPTITRTLVRMEESGWIIRKPGDDKRERIIDLTKKAMEKIPEIKQTVEKLEIDVLTSLKTDEKKQLHYLLSKIGEKRNT